MRKRSAKLVLSKETLRLLDAARIEGGMIPATTFTEGATCGPACVTTNGCTAGACSEYCGTTGCFGAGCSQYCQTTGC